MVDYNYLDQWYFKADGDYRTAEILLEHYPIQADIICFHCQQAVEKWLKAYLVYNGVDEPPKIHDLTKLLTLCAEFDSSFELIHSQCDALTEYGVIPRYPDEFEVTDRQAQRAFEYAQEIRNFPPLAKLRAEIEQINPTQPILEK